MIRMQMRVDDQIERPPASVRDERERLRCVGGVARIDERRAFAC